MTNLGVICMGCGGWTNEPPKSGCTDKQAHPLFPALKPSLLPKITIRHCDDWVAIYKDGQKVEENHSLGIREGLRALGIEFEDQDYYDKVDDLGNLKEGGGDPFPEAID